MENNELAKKIIKGVGGETNIQILTHCVTRLRFILKDVTAVDEKTLSQLEDILGYQNKGGQYQVIVGGRVEKVFREILTIIPALEMDGGQSDQTSKVKGSIFNRVMETCSSILTPSIAPIIGGGMLKGFLGMFTNFHWMSEESSLYLILSIASDCMFYFFPFLLAVSAAKKFKTNEYMALSLAGALMYPTFLNAAVNGTMSNLKIFGFLTIPVIDYSTSIFPIVLGVLLMSYIYNYIDKYMPSMVTLIFTPLITLVITIPILFAALAPLGYYIGQYVALGIEAIINFSPFLSGFIVGATRPLLVLAGIHHALRPITQQQRATYGFSTLSPVQFMSTMAQASGAVAAYICTKDKKVRQISMSATISGYLGITEPALYGVITRYRSVLIGTLIGGGLGGATAAVLGARAYASALGILSLPVFFGQGFTGALAGIIVTVVSTITITIVLWKIMGEEKDDENTLATTAEKAIEKEICSPIDGEIVPLKKLADETFSKEIIGKSFAIYPNEMVINAPINAEIQMIFETKHAIGLKTAGGVELLIHIGLDTVNLKGQYFDILIAQGDKVTLGQPLVKFDKEKIEKAGYDPVVVIVVTNSEKFSTIKEVQSDGLIFKGEPIMTLEE
ncbi:PTS beta-glucoside transporter subunit EIIBCA [Lactococcus hodotermopsidis]|uniref:PTS system sucrose-specific EIIBCA component n=1 Tax=Pseudolactococcus hodotermopsidis TaxID=2709157 RepID=A0A6A0BBS1_9LACT|nr:beta-glucoside-specific PTS transporter subunit IIABC [Lactococcus hodotermopsidis]GFH41834.1 PTS beta-glucoside transporter subunit EIIBCA [Lactococcus hodotermopsidis]